MRRKGSLIVIMLAFFTAALCFIGNRRVSAETTYSFTITDTHIDDISGTVGETITSRTYTISFNGGLSLHQPLEAGKDISNWFSGASSPLPAGITVTVKEAAPVGATSIKVEFSGKTWGASQDTLTMRAKHMYFIDGSTNGVEWIDVKFTNTTVPKFNIVRNFSLPSGYVGVGLFIYFGTSDGASTLTQTNGWKLVGEKGKAITKNNELKVYIQGNFLRSYPAGTDISSWFTGNLIYTNTQTYEITHSFLPNGVTATLKNRINVGDSSFTIVFSGTPEHGSLDFIAITIPAGVTTHPMTDGSAGDSTTALQVNNISGKFSYKITSDDGLSLQEYVKITYPEAEIEVGRTYSESDNLIATYEIIGKDSAGKPLVFENVKVGDPLHGITVSGQIHYDGGLKDNIGLTGKVKSISSDSRTITVVLTGTVKAQRFYPYTITTYRFTLNWTSVNANGRFVNGYDAGESKFKVIAPTANITITVDNTQQSDDSRADSTLIYDPESSIISASLKLDNTKLIYTNAWFWIDLGDDELAVALGKNTLIPILQPQTGSNSNISTWNGIFFKPYGDVPAGTSRFQARIVVDKDGVASNYSGFLSLAFPKSYLKNMAANGTEAYYYLESNKIYVDLEVRDVTEIQTDAIEIKGVVDYEEKYEKAELVHTYDDGSTLVQTYDKLVSVTVNPVATGRLYFNITLDGIVYVPKDFSEGDALSAFDFLILQPYDVSPNPFENSRLSYWNALPSGLKYPTIYAAEDIQSGYTSGYSPRTIRVYLDLSELKAVQSATGYLRIKMLARTRRTNGDRAYFYSDPVITYKVLTPYDWKQQGGYSGGGSGAIANDGIDYSSQSDVIIYATDASGNKVDTTYINMTEEKLVTDLEYDCYSTDGGSKWKAVTAALTDKQIASMLNKGMTLVLADKFDKKAKKPADDATVYTFSTINKRATAPKLKAEYSTYADETGASAGQWALANSSLTVLSAEEIAKLEIGVADGKSVSSAGFGAWPAQGGLAIAGLENGKSVKTTYYVRVKATEDTPASKIVKISVAGQQKAPNLKIDYKKEIVKGKANASITCNGIFLAKNMTKDAAKNAIELADYLNSSASAELKVWICATDKKPASAVQTISAAKRFDASSLALSDVVTYDETKHTVKLAKGYEAYDATKQKWGSMPKVTASTTIQIRRKADAKGGKESESTFAASDAVYLVITWGTYEDSKGKEKTGITACEFSTTEPVAGGEE